MAAINEDYQNYYLGFCERLKEDPTFKFSRYCEEVGAPCRRLYDWMKRRHISLRRLYEGHDQPESAREGDLRDSKVSPVFSPLKVECRQDTPGTTCRDLRIRLPHGASIEIGECGAEFLIRILGGPVGKAYV